MFKCFQSIGVLMLGINHKKASLIRGESVQTLGGIA